MITIKRLYFINKILKDITIRSKVIKGQRVHYIPGWDCHGLPIELKALSSIKKKTSELSALQIRTQGSFCTKTKKTSKIDNLQTFLIHGFILQLENLQKKQFTNKSKFLPPGELWLIGKNLVVTLLITHLT